MNWLPEKLAYFFRFGGRIGRGDYNIVSVVAMVLILLANIVLVLPLFLQPFAGPLTLETFPMGWNVAGAGVLMVIALLIAVSSTVRRLHDFGWSGWWMALALAPLQSFALVACVIGMVILSVCRGKDGPNAYGDSTPPNQFV